MSPGGTRILLIRHATTAMVGKALTGWLPGIPLDEEGRQQALDLMERLRTVAIDEIWSSPLQRAWETAQPLANDRKLPIIEDPDFGEINFGNWQGLSLSNLESNPEFHRFNVYRSGTRAPGGELMLETQARMVRGLLRIASDMDGGEVSRTERGMRTLAVFSHADAIKCAVMHALGMPIDFHHRLEIQPASVTILHCFPEIIRVIQVNTTVVNGY